MMRGLFTTDHRAIGRNFFFLSLISAVLGILLSLLMRFHVVNPGAQVRWWEALWPVQAAGGIMTPELYLALMTIHGSIMVFFVLTVAPQHAFGSLFLPEQIGAREMAFPRLHAASFWLIAASLAVMLGSFSAAGGGPISGWTAYVPLSAVGEAAGPGQGLGQSLWIASVGLFSVGSLIGSVNFLVTVIDLRAPGMRLMRMPLTVWNWLATAALSVPAFTVLLVAAAMLLSDRHLGTSFFVPGGLVMGDRVLSYSGGSPLLWQHLFWFFGHPEVYIAILPAMGIVSEVLAVFSRRPVFGYRTMVGATGAIAVLGLLVWGHHMFTSGLSPYSKFAFSLLTLAIGVPSAVKVFHWLGTIWGGSLRLTTAMLFALAFVSVFLTGGLSGIVLAQPGLNAYFHDTYFVVAHFHFIMGVSAVFGIFSATYFWFPKLTGRMLNERLGRWHFYVTFAGVHLIFLPMHFLGLIGNPRRYPEFTEFEFLRQTLPVHDIVTWAAFVTGFSQLIFLGNLWRSWRSGARAEDNPWDASTYEWTRQPETEPLPRGDQASQTGVWTLAAIAVMWFAGLNSALIFRKGISADWTPTGFTLPAGIVLVLLGVLLVAASRPGVARSWMHLLGLGVAALAVCVEAMALAALSGEGPAIWFSRLTQGSFLLFGVLGVIALARGLFAPWPNRQWLAAVQFWLVLGLLWWISRVVFVF